MLFNEVLKSMYGLCLRRPMEDVAFDCTGLQLCLIAIVDYDHDALDQILTINKARRI